MTRRDFTTLIGSAAGALTCADVLAAQKSPVARIGCLAVNVSSAGSCASDCKSHSPDTYKIPECFVPIDLHTPDWSDGENIQTAMRHGNDDHTKRPMPATELVALRPSIVFGIT
jgi:hypothetical protein